MQEISVNEALRIGKTGAGLRFVVPFYLTFMLAGVITFTLSISFYLFFISFPVGILLSYYFTTRYLYQWQIWAFRHVRNVHELKLKAQKWGLIPGREGRIFPPTAYEELMLQSLKGKFSQPDIVPDDSRVPAVFEIYYSRNYNRFELISWSFGFVGTTWVIIAFISQNQLQGDIVIQVFLGGTWLTTLFFTIENFIQLRTTEPVIRLTPEGIQIKRKSFTKAEVKEIDISDGKEVLSLKFHATKIPYPIEIADLDVDVNTLVEIAEVFVRRWQK